MTIEKAFELYPDAKELHVVGGEIFFTEAEAKDYSGHFKLGKPDKHVRPTKAKATKATSAPLSDPAATENTGTGETATGETATGEAGTGEAGTGEAGASGETQD